MQVIEVQLPVSEWKNVVARKTMMVSVPTDQIKRDSVLRITNDEDSKAITAKIYCYASVMKGITKGYAIVLIGFPNIK